MTTRPLAAMIIMGLKIVKKQLRRFLALDDTPERIAFGFAVGVFISFSPLLGLHTLLGMLIAVLFGLNRVAVFTGLWVNNPWTLLPVYSVATYLGRKLTGFPPISLPDLHWQELWHREFWLELAGQWHALKPLVLGSSILAVIAGVLSYMAALYWLRQRKASSQKQISS